MVNGEPVKLAFFRRLKHRSRLLLCIFLACLAAQFATHMLIVWKQHESLTLRALLVKQKSEFENVGRTIQEIILLQYSGSDNSRFLTDDRTVIAKGIDAISKREAAIDILFTSVFDGILFPSGEDERQILHELREDYLDSIGVFLNRAEDVSANRSQMTGNFLAITDLMVAPHGTMMYSFEAFAAELDAYIQYLDTFLFFMMLVTVIVLAAVAVLFVFFLMGRLIDRAANDFQRLLDSFSVRTRFFYQMSHELQTPLNAINGYSELMASQFNENDKSYGYAKSIHAAGSKLSSHIDNIIILSHVISENYKINSSPFSIADAIREQLNRGAETEIRTELLGFDKARPEFGLADREAFQKMFQQVFLNAIRHAATICTIQILNSGNRILVEVSDDGEGIDPKDVPRLVEPFQTSSNSYFVTDNGPGLGLAVVNCLSEITDIEVAFSRCESRGCKVTFSIPAAQVPVPGPDKEAVQ